MILSSPVNCTITTGEASGVRGCVAPPPILTGGVNSQRAESRPVHGDADGLVSVHWLQGTFPASKLSALAAWLESVIGSAPEVQEWGRYRYDCSLSWVQGVTVFFDSSESRAAQVHNNKFCLSVTGSFLDSLTSDGLYEFCRVLFHTFWLRASRVDIAFDDYKKIVLPAQVAEYAGAGSVSGFRKFQHIQDKRISPDGVPQVLSDTCSFGSRGQNGSGRFLRVYDKALESDGRLDCVRWELETSGDVAQEFFSRLGFAPDIPSFAALLAGVIGGCITFMDRRSKNLDRNNLLPFWADMLAVLGRVCLRHAVTDKTVEKAKGWVAKQVACTLAMLQKSLGDADFVEFIHDTIKSGSARLNVQHYRAIQSYAIDQFLRVG